ncbi:MAG: hypothetical protein HY093_02685 [Candidatus Liptonbacteria bacterium]|nr:hypothetical protein [Candidatus Liptonbacteria bacterium]
MAKSVPATVSGAGLITGFWSALEKARQKRGISDADFHAAVTEESPLIERFAEMILESSKPKFPTYTLSINYDRSVADGIAAGKYDWVNSDITQDHFPSKRNDTAEVGVQLVHFERDMTTDDVLCELDKLGLRPAELPELLALGEKHPDLQREFPVVALGSRWLHSHGRWLVPALARHDAERALRLRWVDVGWGGIYRFAAVSK